MLAREELCERTPCLYILCLLYTLPTPCSYMGEHVARIGKVDLVRKLWVGMAWAAKPCTALRLG